SYKIMPKFDSILNSSTIPDPFFI
ncbi:hypothetical protein AZZ80_003215, partial [Klebsiella pneumoniae]